jgi:hypothetical protein
MEMIFSSKTLGSLWTIWCYNPEDLSSQSPTWEPQIQHRSMQCLYCIHRLIHISSSSDLYKNVSIAVDFTCFKQMPPLQVIHLVLYNTYTIPSYDRQKRYAFSDISIYERGFKVLQYLKMFQRLQAYFLLDLRFLQHWLQTVLFSRLICHVVWWKSTPEHNSEASALVSTCSVKYRVNS